MPGTGQDANEPQKGLFRIGEVSRLTDTKPFVLRYWETEFPMLQPVKTPKGHRLYRREDIEMVLAIKRLLYDEGFTIAGARRHLTDNGAPSTEVQSNGPAAGEVSRDGHRHSGGNGHSHAGGRAHAKANSRGEASEAPLDRQLLREVRGELHAILTLLRSG